MQKLASSHSPALLLIAILILIGGCSAGSSNEGDGQKETNDTEGRERAVLSFEGREILTCTPGCMLFANDAGKPIVPEWCVTWQPQTPFCVRDGESVFCSGRWMQVVADVAVGYYSDEGTEFHLPDSESRLPYKLFRTHSKFVCTQIDLGKIPPREADLSDPFAGMGEEAGILSDLNCSPGCIIGASRFQRESSYEPPQWCEISHDGCYPRPGLVNRECSGAPAPVQRCTGIKSAAAGSRGLL